ncbi:DNA/RNA non-specific endonuclease [Roseomonas sp. BN140053]|uniref:DNA/RNA non-specific endonuclease n=1 Tax=Roseomonas sp. BN140053 TaxID=3391898 RepID=UPI0039EADE37
MTDPVSAGTRLSGRARWLLRATLLLGLLATAAPAGAARSACPQHHPDGAAPDIARRSLASQARELCFSGYAVLHSGVSRTPLAAAERLTRARVRRARQLPRENAFHEEQRLPENERADLADYARSGFDRGHMAPSGDMATETSQNESFSLANMVPQSPGSNRCLWEGIERTVRELATDEGEVWVATGPVFEGTELRRLRDRVLVPTSLFKAIYVPSLGQAGAYLAPNAPGLNWRAVSLAELRDIVGLDIFPSLPAAVRNRTMALPEPEPSNIYGSCDSEPGPVTADRRPSPSPGQPAPAPASRTSTSLGGKLGLWLGAIFALLAVLALFRVLGRR